MTDFDRVHRFAKSSSRNLTSLQGVCSKMRGISLIQDDTLAFKLLHQTQGSHSICL